MNDRSTPDNTLEQPPASYAGRTRFTQLEYEAVLANASIGIAFTRDRKFFLCNPKFADLFGWHPDELIGQAGEVVYASRESYEALGRIAVPVLTAGKQLDLDWEMRRKDGSTFLGRVIAKAISTADPRQGTVWIVEDVTAQRRAGDEVARLLREQEALLDNVVVGISFARERTILRCNRRFEELFGYDPGEADGTSTRQFYFTQQEYDEAGAHYVALARGETHSREQWMRRRGGSGFWCRMTGRALRPGDARRGTVWLFEDITEARRASEEVRRALAEQQLILDNATIGITFLRDRVVQRCNRRMEEMFGYEPGELVGGSTQELHLSREAFEEVGRIGYDALARSEAYTEERQLRRKDGDTIWCKVVGRAVDPARPLDGSIWIYDDISAEHEARESLERVVAERTAELKAANARLGAEIGDRRQAEERARHLADHDALTGLPNRRLLEDRLTQALALSQRNRKQTAVMFVDLDRFKAINDSLGHAVGDQVLKEVAQRLVKQLRIGDTVCRVGGDEFVVVLPEAKRSTDAAQVAGKIIDTLSQPVRVADRELTVTPSIGIAVFPDDGRDAEALIRNADAAMYHAKESGRANYQFFTEQMNQMASRRLALENDLRHAVQKGELELHYQPVAELKGGTVVAHEALVRWQHPKKGLVPPADFIQLAEDTGLILGIGEWVLHEACRWATFIGTEHGVQVAVNLSARQFKDPKLIDLVRRVLAESGLPPTLLVLEITESTAMQQTDVAVRTLKRLKDLGVSLALDDFGTGYSSLAYLRRFPVDRLKIDRSFIADIPGDRNAESLLKGIVGLAHALGLTVVAEGVETQAQKDFLAALGCDLAQGYLIGRPVDADSAAGRYV